MIRVFRRTYLDAILYGLGFAAVIGCFARFYFLAELSVHFVMQYVIVSIVLCITFCLLREKRWKIILSAALGLCFSLQLSSRRFSCVSVISYIAIITSPSCR